MTEPSITDQGAPEAGAIGATPEPTTGFRPDLEGLRGVAILVVLLFHAGLPFVGGGFIGVDVFFVLSGFLITGLLIREREERGRVDLRTFYARRARRILPAALVVIVVTLGAAALVLSPLDLARVAGDAIASALSVSNFRFAVDATDYFAPAGAPSPFLHYWSLAVEEQFYLVWPALLIVATAFGRPRVGASVVLIAIVGASFAAALYLTDVAQGWAFYSLPTRAWQLGLGGLLAVAIPAIEARGRAASIALAAIGWAGLAAILLATIAIDPTTAYPGTAALLPSVGAAAVILGARQRGSAGLLLDRLPLRFLGRISYSLYLVHWPILVLPAAGLAIGDVLTLEVRVGLAAACIPVAWLCYRVVELPVHRGRWFAVRPTRTLALAGATVAVTVLIGAGVMAGANRTLDSYTSVVATADASPAVTDVPSSPSSGSSGGPGPSSSGPAVETAAPASDAAPSLRPSASPRASSAGSARPSPAGSAVASAAPSPVVSPTPAPTPTPTPAPTPKPTQPPEPVGAQPLPANVQPPLSRARDDTELLVRNGCNLQHVQVQPRDCVFGDPNGAVTVALVGDSHTAQWFPAVERIAIERGWRLVTFTKYDCRFMDIRMYSAILKREYTECPAWREIVIQRLQTLQPQLVIVGVSRFPAVINNADDDAVRQGELLAQTLARVPGKLAILVDTPRFPFDVPGCLSGHVGDARACQVARATAFLSRHRILERTAAKLSGASLIDLSDTICPWSSCPSVLDGMIIYRDNHHLTATFAASLAGAFAATLPEIQAPAP